MATIPVPPPSLGPARVVSARDGGEAVLFVGHRPGRSAGCGKFGIRRLRPGSRSGLDGRSARGVHACLVQPYPNALFLAAMRHHALALRSMGRRVDYVRLGDGGECGQPGRRAPAGAGALAACALVMTPPATGACSRIFRSAASAAGYAIEVRDDPQNFSALCASSAPLPRPPQPAHGALLSADAASARRAENGDEPVGDRWNFDAENQRPFPPGGPGFLPERLRVEPDDLTREVLSLVEREFPDHPGTLSASTGRSRASRPCSPWIASSRTGCPIPRAMAGRHVAGDALAGARAAVRRDESQAPRRPRGGRARRGRHGGTAVRRWPASRGSSGRCSDGASTCAASTGPACRPWRAATRSAPRGRCRASTGPGRPRWPAWPTRCGRPCAWAMPPTKPAADGHGSVRAAAGRATRPGARVVPGRLCRSVEWVELPNPPGHEPVRRWRADDEQALRRQRQVHRAHEQRPTLRGAARTVPTCGPAPTGPSVHHAVLGLPAAPPRPFLDPSAPGRAGPAS
ncbi:deoxyribodipyrimidine photo-lyase-related protein [Ditylenchus destructor]|nr:deoxyribodipyrimidine photo-lyase-related protein [Ditylenchus destructor]